MADTPGGGTTTGFTPGGNGGDTYMGSMANQVANTGDGDDTVMSAFGGTTVTGSSGDKSVSLAGNERLGLSWRRQLLDRVCTGQRVRSEFRDV